MSPILRLNDSEDASARYIGWAPAPASVRLGPSDPDALRIRLRNHAHEGGGKVIFRLSAGAEWLSELMLRLDCSNPAADFQVAGSVASTEDRDATIVIIDDETGEVIQSVELMVRVRKDAERLTDAERDRFIGALATLNDGGRGEYQTFRNVHSPEANAEMHGGPAFLPWHRAYLLDVERELQRICASVTIPYWRYEDAAPGLFSPDFIGGPPDANGFATFTAANPLFQWIVDTGTRIERTHPFFDPAGQGAEVPSEETTLGLSNLFDRFRCLERSSHLEVHLSFGMPLADLGTAVCDPLFFLLHANVDRLWAKWQHRHSRYDPDDASTYTHTATGIGHRRDDTMWPWNGVTTGSRPSNAPGGTLAPSPVVRAPGLIPLVRAMIDYQGVRDSSMRLGFDYEDVPCELVRKLPPVQFDSQHMRRLLNDDDVPSRSVAELVTVLRDHHLSVPERLQALRRLESRFLDDTTIQVAFLDIVRLTSEPAALRTPAFRALRVAKMSSPTFVETRPSFMTLLRGLIDDTDPWLRNTAIELLAMVRDDTVQTRLLSGLERPATSVVSPSRAIQLLAYDPHGEHIPFCQVAARESTDPQVRVQAIRALAADPQSAGFLRGVFANRDEPSDIRIVAALSLRALDPRQFAEVARTVLASDSEDAALRTICDVAFKHSPTLANL
jgi:tyrosinase